MILRCLVWAFWRNSEYLEIVMMNTMLDIVFSPQSIESLQRDDVYAQLVKYINELINTDFEKLVQLLYRIDVSEAKLKALLQANPQEDAAKMIANLIIERQLQKLKSRKQTNTNGVEETDAELW
jgi:hypothetical protein